METADAPAITSAVSADRIDAGANHAESVVLEAFELHAGRLTAFARRAVRDVDTADDLVQESFLRLIQEVRAGSVPDNIGGWLYRVCGNLIVSRGRRRTVAERMKSLLVERGSIPSPEERVVRSDDNARILAALDTLPVDARVAVLMAAAGHSSAEIGEAIGRTSSATQTYLCRARVRLRELVAAAEEAPR